MGRTVYTSAFKKKMIQTDVDFIKMVSSYTILGFLMLAVAKVMAISQVYYKMTQYVFVKGLTFS